MVEMFENVCTECGKTFETDDANTELCMPCWEELINKEFENEGKGSDID